MIRKSLAAGVAVLLASLALPALPASASALAGARLASSTDVTPGAKDFAIAVTNNEAGGLLGAGKTINTVRINFPVNEAGIGLRGTGTAPAGWTATATDLGTTEYVTYRGGSIAPGATTTFTFPAAVARPVGSDRRGDFRVQVSSDDAKSFSSAAAPAGATLIGTVRILEITAGSVRPTAPIVGDKGVGDRSGTAGQTVTYGASVVNHASGPVSVTPTLASSDASDKPGTGTAVSVPGNDGKGELSVPVTLGNAPAGGQLARQFTVKALGGSATSPTSTSPAVTDAFTVQAPLTFSSLELTPTRTKSGEGSARTFTVRMSKGGVQGATVDTSTLTFGGNSRTVGPLTFPAGANTQNVAFDFTRVEGLNGDLSATASNAGKDDNLAALSTASFPVGTITIDNLAPLLDVSALLPVDADGDRQVASSNDDEVEVTGAVRGTDLDRSTLAVKLKTDNGKELPVTVTLTNTADGFTFKGTVDVGTWDAGATRFFPTVAIKDIATNEGFGTGISYPIDIAAPVLKSFGTVLTPTTIQVEFLDPSQVRGGCDPSAWSVSGRVGAVSVVRGNGDAECKPGDLSDGVRTLVLNDRSALGTTELPTVTYTPLDRNLTFKPAKDGAGNDALRTTIGTVSKLTPLAPSLTLVERRNGGTADGAFEGAYLDPEEKAYYTNASGDAGNRVTVSGVRNGYVLQVRDKDMKVLKQTSTFNDTSPFAPSTYNGTVDLPVGTVDGKVARFLTFFVPATGNVSLATPVDVVLDRIAPVIASAVLTSPTTVKATFKEAIVAGTDAADDWFVTEQVATEEGTAGRTVNVNTVSADGQLVRNLTVDLLDSSKYQRTDYFFQSPSGTRYEDRAGTGLKSTLTPVAP